MIELRGSSWHHERGHAPMVATAAEYERLTGGAVRIRWEPRSLKEFGVASVEDLARDYDLVVIDHPHIGLIAETGCAVPLDEMAAPGDLAALGPARPAARIRATTTAAASGRWPSTPPARSAPAARTCSRSRRAAGTRCWS